MRQASAPELPPDHDPNIEMDGYAGRLNGSNPGEFRSRSQGNLRRPPPVSRMHSVDETRYKTEGSVRGKHNSTSGGVIPVNPAFPPDSIPFHQCIGTTNPIYRRSGGDLRMVPSHQQPNSSCQNGYITNPRNNGYLSDGEGYAIRNRRISKSGRYGGSHGSSPGANGPSVPFGYNSNVDSSRKSPYQQCSGIQQRQDSKGFAYPSPCTNDRSGDDTRDDEDDDDDDDDGYMEDNLDERDGGVPQHQTGISHVGATINTTPADTDDLDEIDDDADDDEENDDDIEDERDMEDTNEDRTTASGTATVVAAAVTTAALKTTKNGIQNDTDIIVSYSTYQAQTAAIGTSSANASKVNRAKVKSKNPLPITNNQGNLIQSDNNVRGADSSCEEPFAATIESTLAGGQNSPKITRSNNSSGCSIENEEGKRRVSKSAGKISGGSSQKNSRNNSRQGIYSSDQSSTGGDHALLPPPPEHISATSQSSGVVRRRRGQIERADSQHSSSGGGGYRSEPGNCTSCGDGAKDR